MIVPVLALAAMAPAVADRSPSPVHVEHTFRFVAQAPLAQVAPLFGPQGERAWVGAHWQPEFLFPQPGKDQQGAVFTVDRDGLRSTWVNTIFDLREGRMQYVAFLPKLMVSVIEVRLFALSSGSTEVEVTYARTALTPEGSAHVRHMGEQDQASGPVWAKAIASALSSSGQHR